MTDSDDSLRLAHDDGRLRAVVGDRVRTGRAIRLPGVTADCAAAALDDPWVVTRDPPPLGASLARAARSLGETAPQADRLAELNAALDGERSLDTLAADAQATDGGSVARLGSASATDASTIDTPTTEEPDLSAARRRAAEAGEAVERLRERAATLRGRLAARRETDAPTEPVASDLSAVMRKLSEAETERHAAQQSLERARRRARDRRDRRERRLRLRDERRNRRREAREWLAARVADPFREALRRVAPEPTERDTSTEHGPAEATVDPSGDGVDGCSTDSADDHPDDAAAVRDTSVLTRLRARVPDPVTGRLAAAAVAADDGAVVLAVDRDPDRLADRLDRPVVRVGSA